MRTVGLTRRTVSKNWAWSNVFSRKSAKGSFIDDVWLTWPARFKMRSAPRTTSAARRVADGGDEQVNAGFVDVQAVAAMAWHQSVNHANCCPFGDQSVDHI